jgi:putative iron-dependent peroxidase
VPAMTAQPGIVAMGTSEHLYLQGDIADTARDQADVLADVLGAVLAVVEDLSTTSGANVVVGVRPELWPGLAAARPQDAVGFTEPVFGTDGYTMPATQTDFWLWASAGSRTAVFDVVDALRGPLAGFVVPRSERDGWAYRGDRDLTGFIDGTENPSLLEAYAVAVVPSGPGAGSSVVLVQQWKHQSEAFMQLPVEAQERIIGRSKDDSIELDPSVMPPTSHVSRTVLERDGVELPIFRRNTAYGGVTDHGTLFVGFSQEQFRLTEMLRRMAGVGDGVRDALTRFTTPLTGAYYVCPAADELLKLSPEE